MAKEDLETMLDNRRGVRRTRASTTSQIHVAVADACSVMRRGLIHTIEAEPQMRVVASAAHRHDLVQALQQTLPDVLVIDPVGTGDAPVPLVREILSLFPRLKIVIFSPFIEFVPELLATGVQAYVAQKEPDDQLLLAIRAAKARQRFLSPLVQDYIDCHAWPTHRARLGPRELLCLMYMAQGLDNQAICLRMDVELRTVENYVTKIRAKTGCESRAQMIAWYQLAYGDEVGSSAEPCLIRRSKTRFGEMTDVYPGFLVERREHCTEQRT